MGKRTYYKGSHVLKSPPLDPFYIEKPSDYHPNLRHFPDYRKIQHDRYEKDFVPRFFQPLPIASSYQEDYNVIKNEKEQFKDFKTINLAKCVKSYQTRDYDNLLQKSKVKINNVENPKEYTVKSLKFPHLSVYDTTYNRMEKVHDYPEIERETRERQKLRKNKNKTDKNTISERLNKRDKHIYSDNSSHFSKVYDDNYVCNPCPNSPSPFSIYPLFHSAKGDFTTSYKVFYNNKKYSIPEPDIYQIKQKIYEEEKQIMDDILKKNNLDVKRNININI